MEPDVRCVAFCASLVCVKGVTNGRDNACSLPALFYALGGGGGG